VPQLKYTELRCIGWHVSYRDPKTGSPKRHRFGDVSQAEAERAYHTWVAAYLAYDERTAEKVSNATLEPKQNGSQKGKPTRRNLPDAAVPGSIAHIASGLIRYETDRVREDGGSRASGTITPRTLLDRKKAVKDFLAHLNERYGVGAAGKMQLDSLTMDDVESYNRELVENGIAANTLNRKMQVVKKIVDRAGRPEYGQQVLPWNWDSLDRIPGRGTKSKRLPTKKQLQAMLKHCDARGHALIWMGIGLGFGQSDLANVRIGQIDEESYDLRRGKTGIERYGETPPRVWAAMEEYLEKTPRRKGELLFVTETGHPIVHTKSDSIFQWWRRLREAIGESKETLDGFYILRHLGATEFGSRRGCSIAAMKRWLGHSASSQMADRYMKPVAPEQREVIQWLRRELKR
jgi:integrase